MDVLKNTAGVMKNTTGVLEIKAYLLRKRIFYEKTNNYKGHLCLVEESLT